MDKNKVNYSFLEFDSEAQCDQMKEELSNSPDRFFVDYVGEKSRNLKFTAKDVSVKKRPINPLRLFVSGLPASMTVAKLTMLFPKCSEAHIKTKGSPVGFIQFRNAGDAKCGKLFPLSSYLSWSKTQIKLDDITTTQHSVYI